MTQQFRAYETNSKFGLVIVTGGSSGIGNSIIERFAKLEPDACVFNLSRRKPDSFSIDPKRRHLECDLSDSAARAETFDQLLETLGKIESPGPILLVNNAGFGLYGPVEQSRPGDHLALIQVNVCALVELTTRLLPLIKQGGGSIMNIASTAAFQPTPQMTTYGASKAFVLNWTLALNEELKGSPARALCVCPGPTRTDFFQRAGFGADETPGGFSHSADQVAASAIDALYRDRALRVTGLLNKVLTSGSFLPIRLRTWLAGKVIGRLRAQSKSR